MTNPDPDVFAYNDHANRLRRDKAKKIARVVYDMGATPAQVLFYDEETQKAAEHAAGVRTQHRPDLWAIVLELLEQRYEWDAQHPPEPVDTTVPDPVGDGPLCVYGCRGAHLYPGGWLCDEHRPGRNT